MFFSFVMIWWYYLFRYISIIAFWCLMVEALHTEFDGVLSFTEFQLDTCTILPGLVVFCFLYQGHWQPGSFPVFRLCVCWALFNRFVSNCDSIIGPQNLEVLQQHLTSKAFYILNIFINIKHISVCITLSLHIHEKKLPVFVANND